MCPKVKYCFDKNYIRPTMREVNVLAVEEIETTASTKFSAGPDAPEVLESTITSIRRLPTTWKETYVVRIDSEFDCSPCDSIGIYAPNSDMLVERIFRLCGLEDRCVRIERTGQGPFNFEGMLSHFVRHKLDITTLPRKMLLMSLSRGAGKRKQLEYLCSKEGTRDYLSLGANWNTLADIIEEFECRPTLEDLIVNCELIKPRYYTLLGRQAEILVGIISKSLDGQTSFGHVSGFIRRLSQESLTNVPVEICFRRNKLFDQIPLMNLVCFCTGTGIAPYIAFSRTSKSQNPMCLVYGFRSEEDNILKHFDIGNEAIEVKSSENNYIQDCVDIIGRQTNGCCVFICGNFRMQRSVFTKIRETYPDLVEDKRIFFDSWQ